MVIGRGVVPGVAGCAMAHPDFGRSVNPILTRGTDYDGSALISLDFNFPRLYFPYTLISLYFNFPTLISLDYDFPMTFI